MTGLEIREEMTFYRHVKARGYKAEKLERASERGFPDRTVFLPNGRTLFVEFKKPGGGTVSPQQRATLARLSARSSQAFTAGNRPRSKPPSWATWV